MAIRTREKIRITRLAPGKYLGVTEAAKTLRVSKQAVYMYCSGYEQVFGKKKRDRIEYIDLMKN